MMDKPLTSFRDLNRQRKRQQEAADAARSLADSVADSNADAKDYTDQLGDMQAAQELTSEAAESSVNELRGANTTLKDQLAAHELIAENTEQTNKELRNIGSKLDEGYKKISEFAQLLKDKFSVDIQQTPITPVSPSSDVTEVIEQDMPTAEPPEFSAEDYLKRIADGIEKLSAKPPKPKPSDDDTPAEEEKPDDKKNDDERFELLLDRVAAIAKTVDKGYKRTINIADDIASMLFKYTVTAAMNAAKMAALIFGIVLLTDVIQIHFRHWSKMFESNYAEFKEKLGSLADPMGTIITRLSNLVDYWKNKEYGEFVKEIGRSVADASMYLFEYLLLGLSKLFAVAFRAAGMDKTADTIEASSALRAAKTVGYEISDEEFKVIGRVEQRDAETKRAAQQTAQGVGQSWYSNKASNMIMEMQGLQKLDDPDMLAKAAVTQAKIEKLTDTIARNTSNPKMNEEYGKELMQYRAEVGSLKGLLPERMDEIKKKLEIAEAQYKEQKVLIAQRRETQPAKDDQVNPDVATANSITAQEAKPVATKETGAQITQNTNVVNSNKVVNVNNPQTNMSSPGLGYTL